MRQWLYPVIVMGCIILIGWAEKSRAQQGIIESGLLQQAKIQGTVRVIVHLDAVVQPEGDLQSTTAILDQRNDIMAAQTEVAAALGGTPHRITHQFRTIPFMGLEVNPDALAALERAGRVLQVVEDRPEPPSLAQSVPLAEADQAWAAGFDGSGWAVAILDTGVDKSHPFLAGKVIAEACYSGNSNCPNGSTTQTTSGAGVPCTYAPGGCRHGTHVAGIAAGRGTTSSGVARGANVIAIQVFSRFTGSSCTSQGEDPCTLSYTSDTIAGMERVYALRGTYQIAAVNMSLGGGRYTSQTSCDADNASRKAIIDNLRSVGIATVISSGNDGHSDALGSPGCISSAVSVGSTTKTDAISSFSNSASFLSILAPGSAITSSVPGGGFSSFNGTSMAAPHVTGAWAILRQKTPTASVPTVLNALQSTGLPITDPRNGITKSRIRIARALGLSAPSNDAFANRQPLTGASGQVTGTNVNATKETGEPNHAGQAGDKSVWWRWTAPASGQATVDTHGSSFDTLLAVYRGTSVNSLTAVASNDDVSPGLTSGVSFTAQAGTTYHIAVDGYGGASGSIALHWRIRSPNDVIIDFGPGSGLWVWQNNSTWRQLHGSSADTLATGDLDGNGQADVIIDFGPGAGLWVWQNNSTWRQLHSQSARQMVTGNVDGN